MTPHVPIAAAVLLLIAPFVGAQSTAEPAPPPPAAASPQPGPTPPPALTEAQQRELAEIVSWQKRYFRAPDPEKLPEHFRRRAELGALATGDQGWTEVAFVTEVLRANPSKVAAWCEKFADLPEPARGWWWTAVWQAQIPEAAAAIESFQARADGDPAKLTYVWLSQKPQSILDRTIRGTQQLAMLWAAFFASGNDAFLLKTFEAIPDPDLSDPKLSERARQRRLSTTAAARHQLASAAGEDADLARRLRTLAESREIPVRDAVLRVLDHPPQEGETAPLPPDGPK